MDAVASEPYLPPEIEVSGVRPKRRRFSPGDTMRLMVGVAVTLVGLILSTIGRLTIRGVQADLALALAKLPNRLEDGLLGIAQLLASLVPTVATVYMLVQRRFRLFATLVGVGIVALLAMAGFDAIVQDRRLAEVLAEFNTNAGAGLIGRSFPSSGYVAAATAIVTVASPWLSRRWRQAAWGGIAVIVLLRLTVSVVPAVDVLLALGVGTVVGSLALLIFGSPSSEPSATELVEALRRSGFHPVSVIRSHERAGGPAYHMSDADGRRCFVKLRTPHDRDADLLNRLYRALRFRSAELGSPFTSLKRQVEHEALLLGIAERAGVRAPDILGLGVTSGGSAFLVQELARASPALDTDLADATKLRDLWHQVARLHQAGVTHRRLALENFLVDDRGHMWLVDFDESETASEPQDVARDVAELLVVSAMAAGPGPAVKAAVSTMGTVRVAAALPYLQPLALSWATRRRVRSDRELLPALRERGTGEHRRGRGAARASRTDPAEDAARHPRFDPGVLLAAAAAGPVRGHRPDVRLGSARMVVRLAGGIGGDLRVRHRVVRRFGARPGAVGAHAPVAAGLVVHGAGGTGEHRRARVLRPLPRTRRRQPGRTRRVESRSTRWPGCWCTSRCCWGSFCGRAGRGSAASRSPTPTRCWWWRPWSSPASASPACSARSAAGCCAPPFGR